MCGLCKLNAAALDTTVACGYNGIDQHNLGLLPPIAGIDTLHCHGCAPFSSYCPPIAGIDMTGKTPDKIFTAIVPHRGVYKVL